MIPAGWVRLAGLSLGLLLACGCQRQESGQTITLWHQMLTAERVLLDEAVADFEARHAGVTVNVLYKETEELRSGFQAAVQAGVGPELVFGPSDVIGPYQKMGIIRDMSSWWSAEELAAFLPEALISLPATNGGSPELLQIGDRIGNHLALVYNRDLIDEPPQTTDDMVKLAKSATKDTNGDGVVDQFGLVWNYTEPFFAVPLLTGFGAWLFAADDPARPDLDTPAAVAALELVLALRDEHQVIPANCDYEMADSLFKEGRAAMIINGDWSWGDYLRNPSMAVAPLPTVSATGIPMGPMVAPKGYSLNVNASDDDAKWAMEFIRFMTSAEVQRRFMEQLKTLPSRQELLDDPLVQSDPTLAASAIQMKNGKPMPVIPELRAVWDGMRPAYQMLLGGSLTAAQAAEEMQRTSLRNVELINADVAPAPTADLIRVAGGLLLVGFLIWQRHAFIDFLRDLPRNGLAYALVIPSLLVVFLTIVFPFFFNVVLSFSNMSLTHFRDWQVIGFQNYTDVLQNPTFLIVFAKTIFWTVVNVFCHVAFGLLLAVILNGPVVGKSIYRVLLIIPWAVPAYITALTWRGMFDYQYGAVNLIAARLGLPMVNWLGEEMAAFAACIIANVWLGIPFMMVIALGGMQGIPQSLYEAARIDRASRWHQFWHITVPMLRPVMVPAITLGTIWTFNNLNVIWLVSNGGQPGDKTHILVSYVYRAVFNLYQYGYGAALSMIIFFILLVFSVLFLERTKAADAIWTMREPRLITVCRHAILLVFVAWSIYPAINVFTISLRPGDQLRTTSLAIIPDNWTLDSYRQLFSEQPFMRWMGNSLLVSGLVTLTGVALAALGGYAFSRFHFVGKKSSLLAILTTQMFPATMLLLPLYILIARLHLVNTFLGLMIFYTATALPFCLWQMKGFYDTIPVSLEEAACIDGCTRWSTFYRVTLPLAVPGLVITALFSFMTAWSEYIVAAQVLQERDMFTLPLGLKSFQASMSTQWGLYAASSVLVSLPVVFVFILLSRYLVSGLTLGSVKE